MSSNQPLTEKSDRSMTLRGQILRIFQQEDINFLLTNRIPRRLMTRFIGWFSRIEQPFIRELRPGARPIDQSAEMLVSPCDAVVGASGAIADTRLFQIKGFPYTLE